MANIVGAGYDIPPRLPAGCARPLRDRGGAPVHDLDGAGALRVGAARRVVVDRVGLEVHHEHVDDRETARVKPGDVELVVADRDGDVVLRRELRSDERALDRDALHHGVPVGLLERVARVAAEAVVSVDHVTVEVEPVEAQLWVVVVLPGGRRRVSRLRGRRGGWGYRDGDTA